MLKRLLSVALSLILLTLSAVAMPVFVGATTAHALVDVHEDFGNVNVNENKHYSKENPFVSSGGVMAPAENATASNNLDVSFSSDGKFGNYANVKYFGETSINPDGGIQITDNNLNFTKNGNEIITFSSTIRGGNDTQTKGNLYLYLVGTDKSHTTVMKWWRANHNRLYWSTSAEYKYTLENNVWYNIKVTLDFSKNEYVFYIDGGKFDNCSHKATKYSLSSSKTYVGFGWGFCDNGTVAGDGFDIAEMSLANGGSTAYDEKLTFENGTFADSVGTNWTNGNWSADAEPAITREKSNFGGSHKYSVKLLPTESKSLNIVNTMPKDQTVGSDGGLIVEGSYYEHGFAQMRLTIEGVDSSGAPTTLKVLSYEQTDDRKYRFCGAEEKVLPQLNDKWRRFRFVFDLENDRVSMYTWDESDAANIIVEENSTAIVDLSDITAVKYIFYPRQQDGDGSYMAIDDFRVYEKDTVRFTDSAPADNAQSGVLLESKPSMEFNMPLSVGSDALQGIVTLTDSEGKQIDGKASISASGYGIIFDPTNDLLPQTTYTYTIDGTLTDVFGQTLSKDASISFSTSPYINLKDCTFKQGDIELTPTTELSCDSAISATVTLGFNYDPVPVTLLLALYDAETEVMVDAKVVKPTSFNDSVTLTLPAPNDVDNFDYYPVLYVWSAGITGPYGFEKAVPYMEYISLK